VLAQYLIFPKTSIPVPDWYKKNLLVVKSFQEFQLCFKMNCQDWSSYLVSSALARSNADSMLIAEPEEHTQYF